MPLIVSYCPHCGAPIVQGQAPHTPQECKAVLDAHIRRIKVRTMLVDQSPENKESEKKDG